MARAGGQWLGSKIQPWDGNIKADICDRHCDSLGMLAAAWTDSHKGVTPVSFPWFSMSLQSLSSESQSSDV